MNAYKFIKEHGLGKAKAVFAEHIKHQSLKEMTLHKTFFEGVELSVYELRQAIADYELVESLGGITKAKRELKLKQENSIMQCCAAVTAEMIEQAIKRIEAGERA